MFTLHRHRSVHIGLALVIVCLLFGIQSTHSTHAFARGGCPGANAVYARYDSNYGSVTQTWSNNCNTDFAIATSLGVYILWTSTTGAYVVWGDIAKHYYTYFWPYGYTPNLGFPTSDEMDIPGVNGRYNTFQAGAIYWSRSSGNAWAVYGQIYEDYISWGGPLSCIGGPTSDEHDYIVSNRWIGRYNNFAYADIIWNDWTKSIEINWHRSYCQNPPDSGNW